MHCTQCTTRYHDVSGESTPPLTTSNSPAASPPLDELQEEYFDGSVSLANDIEEELATTQTGFNCVIPIIPIKKDYGPANHEEDAELVPRAIYYLNVADALREDWTAYSEEYIHRGPPRTGTRPPKRKALLIAVRDAGNRDRKSYPILKGPHSDADHVKVLLQGTFGWPPDCFTILKDDRTSRSISLMPTRANVLSEIDRLVRDAQAGDHLFVYFAGHGKQVDDLDGDEIDKKDEALMTCDDQHIIDDELHERLVLPIPAGCRLTAIFDCCNSGTGLDLAHTVYTSKTQAKKLAKGRVKRCSGDIILLAACEDGGFANEGDSERHPVRGLFTREIITHLRERKNCTFGELMTQVAARLQQAVGRQQRKIQYPQMTSSQDINYTLGRRIDL